MRKNIWLILVAGGVLGSWFSLQCFAFDIGSQQVKVSLTDSYVSRYIWRGQDLYADNDPAQQLSVDVSLPEVFWDTDVSFNVWSSHPLTGGHEDGEELDYTFTLSRPGIEDLINLSAGYTYFDFPNTGSEADVAEPWIDINITRLPIIPHDVSMNLFAGYDFQATSGGPDEGWYYSLGVNTEVPLPKIIFFQENQKLSLGIVNWGNDGVADLKPSLLYATDLICATSYSMGCFEISPSINYTINYEEEINSGDDEFWAGLTIGCAL